MMKSVLEGRAGLAAAVAQAAEVAGMLWQKGWAERNGGNLTVNVTEFVDEEMRTLPALGAPVSIGIQLPALQGCWFYCKGTNMRMRDLARDPMANGSIIRICPDCASYEMVADAPVKPTSELPTHLILQNLLISSGSGYKATLHTHPIELVAMSHNPHFLDEDILTHTLWSMIPETLAFAPLGLGVVPYALPSSVDLAKATLEKVEKYDVVLWEKHGTVAVGKDMMDAFDQTDVLNKAACIYMSAKNMGFEPEGMTDASMKEIQDVFKLPKTRV